MNQNDPFHISQLQNTAFSLLDNEESRTRNQDTVEASFASSNCSNLFQNQNSDREVQQRPKST
ncbi:hypothetical protein AKJ16_DCAP05217 [Drosera capensis]